MKRLILVLISITIILLLSVFASAIANPAAIFCKEQGYEYNNGDCIINGEELDAWDYFRDNPIEKAQTQEKSTQKPSQFKKSNSSPILSMPLGVPPISFDWRNYTGEDFVTPVKDQATCGGCWAFAAVGVTEARININLNDSTYDIDLSEQDLISCSSAGNCSHGGYTDDAIEYIRTEGVVKESCFPYSATDESCSNKCITTDIIKILDYNYISPNENAIKQALVEYGPINVYMYVDTDFSLLYTGGIYTHDVVTWTGGWHAVVLVGYDDNGDYWIVKNSWASSWGESGYFRIAYSETVYDYSAWYLDASDNSTFFLDDSYLINITDIDNDGIRDFIDNCPEDSNSNQTDTDLDGLGNVCDNDDDNDTIDDGSDNCPLIQGPSCAVGCPDIPPTITIENQQSVYQTYYGEDLINITIEDVCLDSVWYTLGAANTTLNPTYDIDISAWSKDNYTLTIYANDTANTNYTSFQFLISNGPNITSYTPAQENVSVDENTPLDFTHTSMDPDNDTVYVSWLLDNAEQATTQNWTYNPDFNSAGIHNITLSVTDGEASNTNYWNVTVNNINRLPYWNPVPENQTIDEDSTLNYNINADDNDTDTITYYVNDSDFNLNSGALSFTPEQNWFGDKHITLTASDSYDNITSDIIITVTSINDAPVLQTIADITVNESDLIIITANATDPENDSITYAINNPNFNQNNNNFTWQTDYQDSGIYSLNISATDSNITDWQIVSLTILELDDSDNDGILNTNDPLHGDESYINTNINLEMTVDGSSDLAQAFSGVLPVVISENNTILEFNWNFTTSNVLDLSQATINNQGDNSGYGYLLIKGIELDSQTKTVYIEDLNNELDTVCVADKEIASIAEISTGCNKASETLLTCDGTAINQYSCNLTNGFYKITGLNNSGIKEQCEDKDGDGYCVEDDCRDNDNDVYPGAKEICGNNKDDDCDGEEDEGCSKSGGGSGSYDVMNESLQTKDTQILSEYEKGKVIIRIDKSKIPFAIYEFATNMNIDNTRIITEAKTTYPSYAFEPDGDVYNYITVHCGISNNNITEKVKIKFKIEKEWLETHDPNSVKLLKFIDDEWVELTTTFGKETSDYYYYNAESPGFSLFAITSDEVETNTESKESTAKTTKTSTKKDSNGEVVKITKSDEENKTEDIEETNVTITSDEPESKTGLVIVMAIIVAVIIIGAVFATKIFKKSK